MRLFRHPEVAGLANRRVHFRPLAITAQGDDDVLNSINHARIESHAWINQSNSRQHWDEIEGELEAMFNEVMERPFSFTNGEQNAIIQIIKRFLYTSMLDN